MKILQVSQSFYPCFASGGVVRVAYEISNELVSEGHEVTVYTTNSCSEITSDNKKSKNVEGINVYYFKNISQKLKSILNLANPYYIPLIARKEIKNFDIIHIHESRNILAIVVRYYAKKYRVPYVLQPHGSTSRKSGKTFLKHIFDILFGYNIIRDANKIIAVSKEECRDDYEMGAHSEDIEVIYNGMDIENFKNLPKYGSFKEKFRISERMFLYVGRINPSKGLEFAIKSFNELTNDVNNLVFVIAGEAEDSNYLKNLKQLVKSFNLNNVIFVGFLSEKEKIMAYNDADVFIHTVKYMGGVGLAPLEAILCGTPVIVTEGCGELIKRQNCGYLVEYGNVDELKEKMESIIRNNEDALKKVENGKKFIQENLRWEFVIKRVENIYEDCIRNL